MELSICVMSLPELDVRVSCNWCVAATEGVAESAEAADCRIFHYHLLPNWRRCCCDEVVCS